jgi:uncharacterized protein YegP (UPF0339 family)
MLTATIYPSRRLMKKQWRFRIQAANGEILAQGEDYNNLHDAEHTVRLIFGDTQIVPGTPQVGARLRVHNADGSTRVEVIR